MAKVSWEIVTKPKKEGGLVVCNLTLWKKRLMVISAPSGRFNQVQETHGQSINYLKFEERFMIGLN